MQSHRDVGYQSQPYQSFTGTVIYCKYCRQPLPAENATVCVYCHKSQMAEDSIKHWIPIITSIVAFTIFLFLGGDGDLFEVNMFDWLAAIMCVCAFFSIFFTVPGERTNLRVASFIVTAIASYLTVGWLVPM
jgi:hypothetical protein